MTRGGKVLGDDKPSGGADISAEELLMFHLSKLRIYSQVLELGSEVIDDKRFAALYGAKTMHAELAANIATEMAKQDKETFGSD